MNWDAFGRKKQNKKRPSQRPQRNQPQSSKNKQLNKKPAKKKNAFHKPQERKGSWGSGPKVNLFDDIKKLKSMPALANEGKQKIRRKGHIDEFNPQSERTNILHKVFSLEKRGIFPFNRSPIMPTEKELKERFNFLESLGRPLHKYQEEGVRYLCEASRRLLADGMGVGKDISKFTPILVFESSLDGSDQIVKKLVGDIVVGDRILGQNGKPCRVKAIYPKKNLPMYKVKFNDGTSVVACEDHNWSVLSKEDFYSVVDKNKKLGLDSEVMPSDFKVMTTKEILSKYYNESKGEGNRCFIPTVKPAQYQRRNEWSLDPWCFGYKLAAPLISYFGQWREVYEKKAWAEMASIPTIETLKRKIEQNHLFESEEYRFKFLCGLMDSHGKLVENHKDESITCFFESKYYKLHHGIRELVQSLGGIAKIQKMPNKRLWKTLIELPDNKIPFELKYKKYKNSKYTNNNFIPKGQNTPYRSIESITFHGYGDGVCFTVDEPNSLYCVQHYIVTHNTAQCLSALPNSRKAGAIVVCPTSTKLGWSDEIEFWRPDLAIFTPARKNQFRFPNPGEIMIVGWDSLPSKAPKYQNGVPFVLALDETHYAKSHDTGRHKKVSHFTNLAEVVIGLTGTPMPNKVEDLWNVLKVCGMQRLRNEPMPLLGPRTRFARTFFLWEKGNSRPVNCHPEIVLILKKLMKRRTARDLYKDLPPITMTRLVCPVEPKFRKKLDQILANAGGAEEFKRKVESAIHIYDKGGEVDEHLMRLRAQIDIAKLPEIENWLQQLEDSNEPVVVYSPFRAIVDHLFEGREGWGAIRGGMTISEKKMYQDAFNSGKIRGMAITNSGATGVNLPGPEDNPCLKLFRTSLDWSPATNDQVIKRIDRFAKKLAQKGGINKDHKIQIYDFYFDHKIDEIVWGVNNAKRSILDSMGLRADVDKVKGADLNYYEVGPASTGHASTIQSFGNNNNSKKKKRGR